MTSQQDQIKSLIADIERALGSEKPRKPWVKASDMEAQRQTLAQAQAYLKSLQKTFDAPGGWGPVDPSTGQLVNQALSAPSSQALSRQSAGEGQDESQGSSENWSTASGDTPENVLQALLTEMKFLKSSALQPLRLEMDSLREERDRLKNEVADLAAQSSAQSSANLAAQGAASAAAASTQPLGSEQQLNEFLQVLMERLQERLNVQVSQTLDQLESDHSQAISKLSAAADAEMLQLRPSGQIEELRQLQSRSDQLLVNIDSTLQGMFETLQKNIDSYQLSLNEGIENMHSLGRQGEVIVRSLVDHLTQQLGQTAPPEPAFYPARTALSEAPLAFAESVPLEASAGVPDVDAPDADVPDTVASLDDVLADVPLEPPVEGANAPEVAESFLIGEAAGEFSRQSFAPPVPEVPGKGAPAESDDADFSELDALVGASQSEEGKPDDALVEIGQSENGQSEAGEPEAGEPEDCIREDGTIDLDLLKLDIDRSEDDKALTRDDLMIDARVADDQVVTVTEDPEIEAKVTPTADAEYLADLTLDDLTVDADLVNVPPLDLPESLPDLPPLGTTEASLELPSFQAAEETDLSAVLPDLGGPDLSEPDLSEPDLSGPDLSGPDLSGPVSGESDIGGAASPAASLSEAVVGEAVVGEEASKAVAEMPESALIPDIPDDGEGDAIAGEDAPLSDALLSELEVASQDADELSKRLADSELDTLTSDLEESVVFEAAPPLPATLTDESTPLESALIPDWPEEGDASEPEGAVESSLEGLSEASANGQESPDDQSAFVAAGVVAGVSAAAAIPFDASLQVLESDLDADDGLDSVDEDPSNLLGQATLGQTTPPISPDDFDDDLDFYSETGDVSASATAAPLDGLTADGVTADADDAMLLASDEFASDEFADLPPIVAPSFESPLEAPLEALLEAPLEDTEI
ncbi:MAG: hypothetical protein AAFO84_14180, partial [Cyanobacteria bacterium J06598_1]